MTDTMSRSGPDHPQRGAGPLVAACIGTFLLLQQATVVTVALPRIRVDLHAGFAAMQWVVDVFVVGLAGLLLGFGSLSDVLGRRRVYLAGLFAFTVATAGCALAPTVGLLIATRALQGASGAAMFAAILPIIGTSYVGATRGRAFAIWGSVAGIASATGTLTGGVVAELLGWRDNFWLTLPICVVALVLAVRTLPRDSLDGHPLDIGGMAAFSLATVAVTFAVITGGEDGWASVLVVGAVVVAVFAGVAFLLIEQLVRVPLLSPRVFGSRRFLGVAVVAFGYYFATFGGLPVLSVWLQSDGGLSTGSTSVLLAGQVVVFVVVSLASGRFHRFSPGKVLGFFTVLCGLGCWVGVGAGVGLGWWGLVPMLVLTGLGAGVVSPVFPAVAMNAVPAEFVGAAGAGANTARQLGLALGIAVSGSVYSWGGVVGVLVLCGGVGVGAGVLGFWLVSFPRRVSVLPVSG